MVLIDGHVHFHPCHPLDDALDAAAENATRAGGAAEIILWLVEARGEGSLARLEQARGSWRCRRRDEVSWDARRDPGGRVLIVTGCQLKTAEDLEVLIVGTSSAPAEGGTLAATVEPWLDSDALVMLPWGLGKWTGSRGRAVEEAYEAYASAGLYLADTALRPPWMRQPSLLARAEREGRPVMMGSDPFPFPERVDAIGGTGMVLPGTHDGLDMTWPEMRRRVEALDAPVERFGGGLSIRDFVSLQARMQVRKRLGRGG